MSIKVFPVLKWLRRWVTCRLLQEDSNDVWQAWLLVCCSLVDSTILGTYSITDTGVIIMNKVDIVPALNEFIG